MPKHENSSLKFRDQGNGKKFWTRGVTQAVACVILFMFAGQLAANIQAMNITPRQAQTEPELVPEFLFLNHTQLEASGGSFLTRVSGPAYLIADVWGPGDPNAADLVPLWLGESGSTDPPKEYVATAGRNVWPVYLGQQETNYNLTIAAGDVGHFKSVAIQPVYLAIHECDLNASEPYLIPFNASGSIAVVLWAMMNVSDLGLALDGIPLKQSTPASEFNLPVYAAAAVLTGEEGLVFELDIDCGAHVLTVEGIEALNLVICSGDGDYDGDGLLDKQEILLANPYPDLDPTLANCWGTHLSEPANDPDFTNFFENGLPVWKKEVLDFTVPASFEVTNGQGCALSIEVANGAIANITIDGDQTPMEGIVMAGYTGQGTDMVDIQDTSGSIQRVRQDQLLGLDRKYIGRLDPGSHQVAYDVLWNPLAPADVNLVVQNQYVTIIGGQAANLQTPETDGDGIPDDVDLSPNNFIRWNKDTLVQLAIPTNPGADEDLQVRFQVARPPAGIDRTTTRALDWHPEETTHRQVQVLPAMIIYGPATSPEAQQQGKFWSNLDDLATFLDPSNNPQNKWPVQTYNLVEYDKTGHNFAATGLSGDCDPLPQGDAYAAQMLVLPQLAEKVMEYEVSIPSNHPCIQNDGVVNLRFRFVYALVSQAWDDPQNVNILGWYDLDHDLNISGIEADFYSNCNALLGEPRDMVTHQVLWAYNQNPQMSVDWDSEIQRALVYNVAGAHFLRRYGASDSDPTTWGLLERLNYARNQTAWPGDSAEVTYFTMTTRRVDILAELNASIAYNVATNQKYRVDPATFSLGGKAPGTQIVPLQPPIAGWQQLNSGGLSQVLANVQGHARPLGMTPNAGQAIHLRADPGTTTDTGIASFWFYLAGVSSSLEMQVGTATTPDAIDLVASNGYLQARQPDDTLQELTQVWPGEWFYCAITANATSGTYTLDLDGVTAFTRDNMIFTHPVSGLQTMDFIACGLPSAVAGVNASWAGGPGANNFLPYEDLYAADHAERNSWYEVSDVYNGTYAPTDPELASDTAILYDLEATSVLHAEMRATNVRVPIKAVLVRQNDSAYDSIYVHDVLNITYATAGNLLATDVPGHGGPYNTWTPAHFPGPADLESEITLEYAAEFCGDTGVPTINRNPLWDVVKLAHDNRWATRYLWGQMVESRSPQLNDWFQMCIWVLMRRNWRNLFAPFEDLLMGLKAQLAIEAGFPWGKTQYKPCTGLVLQRNSQTGMMEAISPRRVPGVIGGQSVDEQIAWIPETIDLPKVQEWVDHSLTSVQYCRKILSTPTPETSEVIRQVKLDYNKMLEMLDEAHKFQNPNLELKAWCTSHGYNYKAPPSFLSTQEEADSIPKNVLETVWNEQLGPADHVWSIWTVDTMRPIDVYRAHRAFVIGIEPEHIIERTPLRAPRSLGQYGVGLQMKKVFGTPTFEEMEVGGYGSTTTFNNMPITLDRDALIRNTAQSLGYPDVASYLAAESYTYGSKTYIRVLLAKNVVNPGELGKIEEQVWGFLDDTAKVVRPWKILLRWDDQLNPYTRLLTGWKGGNGGMKNLVNLVKNVPALAESLTQAGRPGGIVVQHLIEKIQGQLQKIAGKLTQIQTWSNSPKLQLGQWGNTRDAGALFTVASKNHFPEQKMNKPTEFMEQFLSDRIDNPTFTALTGISVERARQIYKVMTNVPTEQLAEYWFYFSKGVEAAVPTQVLQVWHLYFQPSPNPVPAVGVPASQRAVALKLQMCMRTLVDQFNELSDTAGTNFIQAIRDLQALPADTTTFMDLLKNYFLKANGFDPQTARNAWYGASFDQCLAASIDKVPPATIAQLKNAPQWILDWSAKPEPSPPPTTSTTPGPTTQTTLGRYFPPSGPTNQMFMAGEQFGIAMGVKPKLNFVPGRGYVLNPPISEQVETAQLAMADEAAQLEASVEATASAMPAETIGGGFVPGGIGCLAPSALGYLSYLARLGSTADINNIMRITNVIPALPASTGEMLPMLTRGPEEVFRQILAGQITDPQGTWDFLMQKLFLAHGYWPDEVFSRELIATYTRYEYLQEVPVLWYQPRITVVYTRTVTTIARSGQFQETQAVRLYRISPPTWLKVAAIVGLLVAVIFAVQNNWDVMDALNVAIGVLAVINSFVNQLSIFATVAGSILSIFSVILSIFSMYQLGESIWPAYDAEYFNRVDIHGIQLKIFTPEITNASILRNGGLREGDKAGIQVTVKNEGMLTLYREEVPLNPDGYETHPNMVIPSQTSPFWFRSRIRSVVQEQAGIGWDSEDDWQGPWAGNPINWNTWELSGKPQQDVGDLIFPSITLQEYDLTQRNFEATPPKTYEMVIPLNATSRLGFEFQTQIATTWNGRTNTTPSNPIDIYPGDTNHDGVIDPAFEQGIPVVERTLDDFLAAGTYVTPAVTLDELIANYSAAAGSYQWNDASNYIQQILTRTREITVLPESYFNSTIARLTELTGDNTAFSYDLWGSSLCEFARFPTSVSSNYYLLKIGSISEWNYIFGGPNGQALIAAGWRPVEYANVAPGTSSLFQEDFDQDPIDSFPSDWHQNQWGSLQERSPPLEASVKDRRGRPALLLDDKDPVGGIEASLPFDPMVQGQVTIQFELNNTSALTEGTVAGRFELSDGMSNIIDIEIISGGGTGHLYWIVANGQIITYYFDFYGPFFILVEWDAIAHTARVGLSQYSMQEIPWETGYIDNFTIGTTYQASEELTLYSLAINNLDERGTYLNAFGMTWPQGLILVPKKWVEQSREAFEINRTYSSLQLSCETNIHAEYSWGSITPVIGDGETFIGSIHFIYAGSDNPWVNWSLQAPPGWNLDSRAGASYLKQILNIPLTVEIPAGTPAGTYYIDFTEQRDDPSPLAGNITFSCQIPIRVSYNATWALNIAGLGDVLDPGSINTWATLFNGGTAPQSLYITGDGVPLDWMTVDGHAPIARWDFNGGTSGWSYTGTSSATFEADRVDLTSMESVNNAYPDYNAQTLDFRASQYYDDARGTWIHDRTYFTVPAAMPTYVNPRSATLHEYLVGASVSVPSALLVISPASQSFTPGTMTWNTQPGYAPDQHAVERLASTLPASGWVSFPGLSFGTTYAVWMQESCTAQVDGYGTSGGSRAYVLNAYDKVTSDEANLVLQSNTNEVISATKNVSALICPGDRVRITYENHGASGATLNVWNSFALVGSGRQELIFIADGFYTLVNFAISARVGLGATFRVDSISLERALTRNIPLSELAFAGETATPEIYGWSAKFGSGTAIMQVPVPVTNAAYIDEGNPNSNFNTGELWVGNNPSLPYFYGAAFIQVPQPLGWYSPFVTSNPPLLLTYQVNPSPVQAYPCGAFNESTLTWATRPTIEEGMGVSGSTWAGQPLGPLWAWDLSNFSTNYICLNTSAEGWWIFPSDEAPADLQPKVMYSISKWGVTGGALVVQTDQSESFQISHALIETNQNVTVRTGDKVWVSFEATSAGGATLVLVNADPLGANLSFPIATSADQNRGTIYREFVIPAGGNYTSLIISGLLGAGQNFSLFLAGVYHYQPNGTPLASASIGGFYNETITPANFTQYAPITGGSFTFDGTTHGFGGQDVSTANGSLVLAPLVASAVTATCALAGLTVPANARVRARYNSTASAGSYIKFRTDTGGEFTWMLPETTPDSWQEATFALPQGKFTQIVVGGSFTPATNLSLDYLLLEVPVAAACVLPEVAGRRDVISLKNIPACGSVVDYSFPEPQTQGRFDFSFYAPGTNATLTITLLGAGGTCIQLAVADWQLWLGNLSGSFAAANIYSGWHDLSIAWDCASHNFTVWYFNQTLVTANYTTGWGILNFPGSAITGIRIGTADARAAYYLDGVYFDPVATSPTNQSLVKLFQPGGGMYVDLRPGEEWSLQLVAPPRSPLAAPGTYPVHLAIYDASTGQLIGLIHKNITIPAFYDIGLTCAAPNQIHQVDPYGTEDGNFDFTGTLANLGNVPQTFTLSAPGLDPRAPGTFYVDASGTWALAGPVTLAPGEAVSYKLEIRGAPTIVCAFAIQAQSGNNMTSIPGSYVYNDMPVIPGGQYQGPVFVEWQPAGKDLLFTAWDNTTQNPWFEAWWNNVYLGQGTWASGQAINVSLDPLFAAGASILGKQQNVAILLHDGFSDPAVFTNVVQFTVIINDVMPATITPPDIVTTWEGTFDALTWDVVDNGAWDPATGWQDDFGDGTLGPQWLPANVTEANGTLRLPPPAQNPMGTQLLAPAPPGGDFAVVTRIAVAPYPADLYGGPGIVIPTDDQFDYIKWQAHPVNALRTSWTLVETRSGAGGTTLYRPIIGNLTTLAVVVHGTGPSATYDLWYCLDDATWTRVVVGHTAFSYGAPAQRRFGLCTGPYDVAAQFDWVRCQTLRPAPGATYMVYKNGTPLMSGGWAGFGTIAVSLDDLRVLGPGMIGNNNFTLVLTDPVGGRASSMAWVNITQVAPVLSRPPDVSYTTGETPIITWDVSDNYAVTTHAYDLYLGTLGAAGTLVESGTWVSGGTIAYTLPTLAPGTYTCRVVATNDLGGVSSDTVILTVVQPTIVPPPAVTSIEVPAGTNQTVTWTTPSVSLAIECTTTDAVTMVASAWDDNPASGSTPGFVTGGAYFAIEASNPSAVQFPLTLTVTLPYDPTLWNYQDQIAQWMGIYIFDENTGTWVLADATVLQVVPWGPMVKVGGEWIMVFERLNVTLSVPHLSTYAVGIINLPPGLSSPADVAYLGGSTGHAITWQVTDDTTSSPTYTITRDGFLVGSGTWPGNNLITIPVDGLAPGAFNYTLVVDDGRHAIASDSVLVVVDNFAPVLSAPVDITYTWGTTGHAIAWQVTDDSFQDPTYAISRDGTVIASGAWPANNVISWNVDGLAVGTYWYRVDVFDGLTGTMSDKVRVTVRNTLPVLSTPPDSSHEYGASAPSIAWTVADETVLAGTYTITLGGFPVANGTWASGDTIGWAPGDLLPGTWTATLTVSDGYGGTVSDAASITVTNAPPVITGPHSAIFEAGNASAGVWVTITDPSAASDAAYGIFRNGTRVASGRWASGGSIYVDLRFTPPGRNDIQVVAWDGLGGVATHSILATTTNMAPIVIAPAPVTFEVGTATPVLQWTITDESAENATYAIAVNGTTFANSTWVSGDMISLPVGGWMPGIYNVTLTAADGWGAVVENGTLVMVTNTAPVVLAPPAINYEAGDPRPVASFVISDMSALNPSYAAYLNGSLVSSGTWASGMAVTINASGLAPGTYILALVATDGYGATSNNATSITVRPDDDTSCDIADLACSATSDEVTVTLSLVDPSGYAGLNYFHVDGATPAGITLTIEGTRATMTFPNAFGPGLHVVEFSLTDGDNDWPGDGAVGVFTCTFRNGPDVQPLLDLVDAGIALVWASNNSDWRKPAANRKAEMASELGDLRAMLEAGDYSAAYDLLLHDLKPKLTGLKTDEHEVPWGNGVFNNPWVTGAALQEQFHLWANALLQGIEDIQVPLDNLQGDTGYNAEGRAVSASSELSSGNFVFLVFLGVFVALGVATGILRKRHVKLSFQGGDCITLLEM